MQQNQNFVRLGQFISHLMFNSMLSILTKTSLCISITGILLNKKFDVL